MTPACVDELARVFSDFEWDRLERADGELARTAPRLFLHLKPFVGIWAEDIHSQRYEKQIPSIC